MKVKNVIEQVEHIVGRQPENYTIQLINDALEEIGITKQHRKKQIKIDLVEDKRWYELEDEMIDIFRVEVLDSNSRYVMIPKLTDAHKLLKEDEY
tara:strand:- start:25 stop:309 length:285 start_codon:yes stop_codon:yes gene_type:complete